jgi:hypothetical protein
MADITYKTSGTEDSGGEGGNEVAPARYVSIVT